MSAYELGFSLGTGAGERARRFLRLQAGGLDSARERLGTGALWAVTVGRIVPGMMPPLSVVSGMIRVPLHAFAACVSLSTLAWAALLACLGAAGGRALDTRVAALNVPGLVASAVATVLVVSLVSLWWRSARTEHPYGR